MSVVVISGDMVYGALTVKIAGSYSPVSRHILCDKHTRGIPLQPFIVSTQGIDLHEPNPVLPCPFCPGGKLHGKYNLYRSKHKLTRALERLEAELVLDERGLRQAFLDELVVTAENDGNAYRDNRNATVAVSNAVMELMQIAKADGDTDNEPFLLDFYEIVMPQAVEDVKNSWGTT